MNQHPGCVPLPTGLLRELSGVEGRFLPGWRTEQVCRCSIDPTGHPPVTRAHRGNEPPPLEIAFTFAPPSDAPSFAKQERCHKLTQPSRRAGGHPHRTWSIPKGTIRLATWVMIRLAGPEKKRETQVRRYQISTGLALWRCALALFFDRELGRTFTRSPLEMNRREELSH